MNSLLLVGTSKGLVVFKPGGNGFEVSGVHFIGLPVSMVYIDKGSGAWWVAISHRHWGEKLHFSTNKGKAWQEVPVPKYTGYEYRKGEPATLKKIWVMSHAGHDRPNCLWLGTEPGGLFFSDDNGKHFHLNESLWKHPSRQDDNQWFGTGKDYPFIHSILVDPRSSNHLYVGVSCAGVFETMDGGKNWTPKNNGLVASYLPKANAEVGHDPHQMLLCHSNPDVIWQQNHCGIFRTTNGGAHWANVSGKDGFPRYGFALAIDDKDSKVAWIIPAESDENRVPVSLKLTVCKTADAGNNWLSINKGLPDQCSFDLVLRHAFVKQNEWLAFGSSNGNLYFSKNNGEDWVILSQNLSSIFSVAFA
jgi:hypothetical protein